MSRRPVRDRRPLSILRRDWLPCLSVGGGVRALRTAALAVESYVRRVLPARLPRQHGDASLRPLRCGLPDMRRRRFRVGLYVVSRDEGAERRRMRG